MPENVAAMLAERILAPHRRDPLVGALFLDADVRTLGYTLPYLGYVGAVDAELRRLLTPGMILNAAAVILFHNRPSGDLEPTGGDLDLTRRVRACGEVMGIRLVDHLLLGPGKTWMSMRADRVLAFPALGDEVILPALAFGEPWVDRRYKVQPKYIDPDDPGQTWSGRGQMARWLREKLESGARLEDFLAQCR